MKKNVDSAAMEQLDQANKSLHRQVEEYKKIVEQLKGDLLQAKSIVPQQKSHLGPPSFLLDLKNTPRQSYR